jgi:hypothetical protein
LSTNTGTKNNTIIERDPKFHKSKTVPAQYVEVKLEEIEGPSYAIEVKGSVLGEHHFHELGETKDAQVNDFKIIKQSTEPAKPVQPENLTRVESLQTDVNA